ncbi:hypothetical protein ACIBTZ_19130 [Micromonospora sp. NPDC049460]|uniref:hypothetical protein n=1 Tax=unclassified Micromonospora TaxID=2617518 RepID=UPI003718EF38
MSETEALEKAGGIDLQHRPTELPKARIAEQQPDTAYALSALGHDAHQALSPLVRWSDDWAGALAGHAAVTGEGMPA